MSPWLFNVYVDGVEREVNARVQGEGLVMLGEDGREWRMHQLLFAGDTALVARSEKDLKRVVEEFGRVCARRNLRVNVGKCKVMRYAKEGGGDILDVRLDGEMLEEMESFKYLGSHVAVNGKVNVEVGHRVKEARNVWVV